MERVQIVRCALMQLTAIVYAVLACGAATKMNNFFAEMGDVMPASYYRALFVRDYGAWLLVIVIIWTALAAYQSSSLVKDRLEEQDLLGWGVGLALVLAVGGTIIAFGGALPPPSLMGVPLHHS